MLTQLTSSFEYLSTCICHLSTGSLVYLKLTYKLLVSIRQFVLSTCYFENVLRVRPIASSVSPLFLQYHQLCYLVQQFLSLSTNLKCNICRSYDICAAANLSPKVPVFAFIQFSIIVYSVQFTKSQPSHSNSSYYLVYVWSIILSIMVSRMILKFILVLIIFCCFFFHVC